jgi:hypothetical protein
LPCTPHTLTTAATLTNSITHFIEVLVLHGQVLQALALHTAELDEGGVTSIGRVQRPLGAGISKADPNAHSPGEVTLYGVGSGFDVLEGSCDFQEG